MASRPRSAGPKKPQAARKRAAAAAALEPKQLSAKGERSVWLTFDDGPHATNTDQILEILGKHGIKAGFFMVGQNAARFGDIVKRVFDAGHRVGNHTYSHPDLTKLSEAVARQQIVRTETILAPYLGTEKILRPPYGAHNAAVDKIIAQLGYRTILWSVDTLDWNAQFKPDKWVQHGIDQIRARSSSRVLNHDIHATTADHLDMFIERIKQLGNVTFESPATL